MFFMHKIEHEWYDKIIGRYDINMTYCSFIMSYRDFGDLVNVSMITKKFFLGTKLLNKVPKSEI